MDSKTGKIYEIESDEHKKSLEEILGTRFKELSEIEYKTLKSIDEENRPEELAVSHFKGQRKKLKAPYNLAVENAYRMGYRAGKKDNS